MLLRAFIFAVVAWLGLFPALADDMALLGVAQGGAAVPAVDLQLGSNGTVGSCFVSGTPVACSSLMANADATGGYCTDATGLLHLIPANTLRICAGTGLLPEQARVNVFPSSASSFQPGGGGPTFGAYTVDQTGPDGLTSGARLTNQPSRVFADPVGLGQANGTYTFCTYVWTTSGSAALTLEFKNASSDVILATTVFTATTAFQRVCASGAPVGTAGARIEFVGSFGPGLVFADTQYQSGGIALSYCPSTLNGGSCAADNITATGALLTALQGAQGGVVASISGLPNAGRVANETVIFAAGPSGQPMLVNLTGTGKGVTFNGSTNITLASASNWQSGAVMALGWSSAGRSIKASGAPQLSDANSAGMTGSMTIGSNAGSNSFLNGYLNRVSVFSTRNDAQLASFAP